jgi:hypothetical protein
MSQLKFQDEGHKYFSDDDFRWVSATKLVEQFKEPFDAKLVAERCSKSKKEKNKKYRGKTVDEIIAIWDKESERASTLGTWYHNQREQDVLNCFSITRDGMELPIISPQIDGKVKLAPKQKLVPGIYPEHLVYLKSASICGQADRVEIVGDRVDVYDYKTNKEIKMQGYEFWDGSKKMMLGPLRHLEDCEFNHYALQLSIYLFIILKHNYNMNPGVLEIHHVEFEIEDTDENGFPIHALDPLGEPIIKKLNPIQLPYLKKEVIMMFTWLREHKKMVLHNEH